MNTRKWMIWAVALAMTAATAGYLARIRDRHRLGAPGVRVGPVALYGEHGEKVAAQSVLLPDKILGVPGNNGPITGPELDALPKDTTFGRRRYEMDDGFRPVVSVVLMGTDRTSIHQPQFCLVGSGWVIDKTEHVTLRIDRPYNYDLPVMKLTTSTHLLDERKHFAAVSGIYVYWFVTADKITADQGVRLWSIAAHMVEKGELERWAYISYFVACPPGQEEVTYKRLEKFIRASVPEFQVVTGKPIAAVSALAAGR